MPPFGWINNVNASEQRRVVQCAHAKIHHHDGRTESMSSYAAVFMGILCDHPSAPQLGASRALQGTIQGALGSILYLATIQDATEGPFVRPSVQQPRLNGHLLKLKRGRSQVTGGRPNPDLPCTTSINAHTSAPRPWGCLSFLVPTPCHSRPCPSLLRIISGLRARSRAGRQAPRAAEAMSPAACRPCPPP